MPTATAKIPTADLKTGMYFKQESRWYRATGMPSFPVGANCAQVKYVEPTTGGTGWMHIYGKHVIVADGDAVPGTFQSAALLRKAKAAHAKAIKLEQTARQLETLAVELRYDTSLSA